MLDEESLSMVTVRRGHQPMPTSSVDTLHWNVGSADSEYSTPSLSAILATTISL